MEYFGNCYPTINQELFFNLGDLFEVSKNGKLLSNKRNWLSAAQTKTLQVKTSGKHLTAGVIFKPWGLYHGFGINAKDLFHKKVDAKVLFDFDSELNHLDISANHFYDFIEHSLIKALKPVKLTVTMQSIINDLEHENLQVLSEKLHRSKKSIIESFNKMIGLSPNKFYHLKSVCEAISTLNDKPQIKLTDLAYHLGYYDQSHFIRTFKEHIGCTPKQFKKIILEAA